MNMIAATLAADADMTLKGDFLRALADPAVRAAVVRVKTAHATLARVERLGLILDAVVRAQCDGASPATLLNETAVELQQQVEEAFADNEALEAAAKAARASVAHALPRILSERLELPGTIVELEKHVRGFDKARDDYRVKLADAGLDQRTIDAVEPVPTRSDLEEWQAAIDDKRARLERINAFVRTAPFFDPVVLGGDISSSFGL
ncbi:hypothetical protein [Caballeronia sp. dw_19]|uniref:hypothetical protein n=1 Tax=Caballeronia sp. dw_19 TaxID=2719791 RepID=UPI001BD399FC|nr:hypothetical protein [Caballeronia sp. dw_19]